MFDVKSILEFLEATNIFRPKIFFRLWFLENLEKCKYLISGKETDSSSQTLIISLYPETQGSI